MGNEELTPENGNESNPAEASAKASANGEEIKVFDVPSTNGEPALFLGFIYSATRSKGKIEEAVSPEGPGDPLYSAYVFPYTPPAPADGSEAEPNAESTAEQPLFVAYVFPFLAPESVVLGGDGGGAHGALGGGGNQILFYGRFRGFIPSVPPPGEGDNG